ncbi:MAG: hypothetical protein WCX65_02875, partial [bacterium]
MKRIISAILIAFTAFCFAGSAAKASLYATGSIPLVANGYEADVLSAGTTAIYISIPSLGQLMWLNNNGANSGTVPLNGGASHPFGVAAYNNAANPKVFVTGQTDMKVYVYEVATGTVQTISQGGNPYGVAVNSLTDRVFVTNSSSNYVYVYNAVTLGLVKLITHPSFNNLAGVVVNEVTNKIYVASKTNGYVFVIDGATNEVIKLISVMNPERLELNEEKNIIYVENPNGQVVIIDGLTDAQVGFVNPGVTITDVAYHPEIKNIYVSTTDSRVKAYNTTDYTEIAGSPLAMPENITSLLPMMSAPGGPWATLAITNNALLRPIFDTDTYAPIFGGLTSAVDAASAISPRVTLHWAPAEDISTPVTYNIYYSLVPPGAINYSTASFLMNTGLSGDVTVASAPLLYGSTYKFSVRAVDSKGNSDNNEVLSAAVKITDGEAPVGGVILSATNPGTGGVADISWSAATDNSPPVTYDIYIALASGAFNWTLPSMSV